MGCSNLHAIISRSSQGLQQSLQSAGVQYRVHGQANQTAARDQVSRAAAEASVAASSQVLVEGVRHVQGLYQALLSMPWCQAEQPDVPILLAPVSFLGATLCKIDMKVHCMAAGCLAQS
eukprot:jgi/Chrzof1/157/Cz01g05140.t1